MLYQQRYQISNRFIPIDRTYNHKLLKSLKKEFGLCRQNHVDMPVSSGLMANLLRKMSGKKARRGEVVMVIPNASGKIWLHTKASYPEGVYRLMTGGLHPGELPHQALHREVEEETGFKIKIACCLAVISYNFRKDGFSLPFASYIFLTEPTKGIPAPTDPSEAITGFQTVPADKLFGVARQLRMLNGRFDDWGTFRAIAHTVVGQCLNNTCV